MSYESLDYDQLQILNQGLGKDVERLHADGCDNRAIIEGLVFLLGCRLKAGGASRKLMPAFMKHLNSKMMLGFDTYKVETQ